MKQNYNLSIVNHSYEKILELRKAHQAKKPIATIKQRFNEIIYDYYHYNRRPFAWRDERSPYRVVVSEIMLQQTQTDRVTQKFEKFITHFPSFEDLATASFEEVLRVWKGLGYNRRAQALHEIAKVITLQHNGQLPNDPDLLVTLKGIGLATAASICAFAFNRPTVFIETNIRTVFIYCFYHDIKDIHDKDLLILIEQMLDKKNPRDWYYALMDYGVMLKKTIGNLCRLSAHYNTQSRFEGSDRQLRGQILQALLDHSTVLNIQTLPTLLNRPHEEERINGIINDLSRDKLITIKKEFIKLS